MSLLYYAYYQLRLRQASPRRYADLLRALYASRGRIIVEIGTNNGVHARHLIQTARVFHPACEIHYYGLDLFEMLTPELLKAEFAIKPPTMAEVERRLQKTGADVHLHRGFSKDTVPPVAARIGHADFIFIDGGHAIDTIRTDWTNVQPLMTERTVVVFDDYFVNDEPAVQGFGCQSLIDSLDRARYNVELLPHIDDFPKDWGVLRTRMAKVSLKR